MSATMIQVLQKGVEYLLDTSDRAGKGTLHIKFCHKNQMGQFVHGVTSEAVLQMMISRYQHLIDKDDSSENIRVLLYLRQALEAVTSRNTNKMKRRNDNQGNDISVPVRSESDGQQVHPGAAPASNDSVSQPRNEPAS